MKIIFVLDDVNVLADTLTNIKNTHSIAQPKHIL